MKLIRIVVTTLLLVPTMVFSQKAKDIAKELFESTVLVSVEDENKQPLAFGSGFIVADGIIVTNYHVIRNAHSGYVKLVNKKQKADIAGVVHIDEANDIVVLSVPGIKGKKIRVSDQLPEIGEVVYAIGNPRGLEGTFSQGIVSGLRTLDESSNRKLIQITAPISPGSSGGPVVNEKGFVIGVAVATLKGGQNLNFCIPSSYLPSSKLYGQVKPLSRIEKKDVGLFSYLESGQQQEAVVGADFRWDGDPQKTLWSVGRYSFSLRNVSRANVGNVFGLVIFYGDHGDVVDAVPFEFKELIPAGLARRVNSFVDTSVKKLTTRASSENHYMAEDSPYTKVEFRILYFQLIED
jgi:hypothetical protein